MMTMLVMLVEVMRGWRCGCRLRRVRSIPDDDVGVGGGGVGGDEVAVWV